MDATVLPFDEAKAFLMKAEDGSGKSLYEHISDVVLKVLEKRPDGALGVFEDLSMQVKKDAVAADEADNGAVPVPEDDSQEVELLETRVGLFKKAEVKDVDLDEEDALDEPAVNEGELPNLLEEAACFEHLGVGLSREDTLRLYLSLRELVEKNPLASVRFFGKFFGTNGDYLVAEAEYKEGEGEELDANDAQAAAEEEEEEEEEEREDDEEADPLAFKKKKRWVAPPVPVERRVGANKFSYFVAAYIGGPWVRLPDVTPAQISVARQIKRLLTGDLTAPVFTYPPFDGNEANLLRAQIAQIAADTAISPKGYYLSEGDEDEEAEVPPEVEVNPDFEDLDPAELTNLENWVHHRPYILPQGRCTYWRPPKPPKERSEDDEDEDDEDDDEELEPAETGPSILSSVVDDAPIGHADAWAVRASSTLGLSVAPVFVASTRWPGAYTFAYNRKFGSIYFGNGQQYTGAAYSPPAPPAMQAEAPALEETTDPTVEQEKELEEKNRPPEDDEEDEEEDDEDDEYDE